MLRRSRCSKNVFNAATLVVLTSCLLTACETLAGEAANTPVDKSLVQSMSEPGEIRIEDQFIVYSGWLNRENNKKLFEVFESADPQPTWLAIHSGGGDVKYGLDLGEWIFENELNVYIQDFCASSCANYVFTAGKQVVLNENAIVGWHGSPIGHDLIAGTSYEGTALQLMLDELKAHSPEIKNPRRYWNTLRIRNRRFFRTVGVHPVITNLNQVADENGVTKIEEAGPYLTWLTYISIEDMKYFGINNVSVDEGKVWNPEANEHDAGLIRVNLVEDVEQKLAELKHHLNQVE